MKAAVVRRYGPPDAVEVRELPLPSIGSSELLVRVEAVAVTAGDARIRGGRFPRGFGVPARLAFGVRGPRRPVLGSAFSGTVERVGTGVSDFAPGDRIAGMNGARMGAHAQFCAVRPTAVAHRPDGVEHAAAAAVSIRRLEHRHYCGSAPAVIVR